jgi:hypothetical protein
MLLSTRDFSLRGMSHSTRYGGDVWRQSVVSLVPNRSNSCILSKKIWLCVGESGNNNQFTQFKGKSNGATAQVGKVVTVVFANTLD